jgi:hypothetical protein
MTDTLNKEEYVEKICDAIVAEMSREDLERFVWDHMYDEMCTQEWIDLIMLAQDYGVLEGDG